MIRRKIGKYVLSNKSSLEANLDALKKTSKRISAQIGRKPECNKKIEEDSQAKLDKNALFRAVVF